MQQKIQLAVSDPGYLAALRTLLTSNGGWEIQTVEAPDPTHEGVLFVDDAALERLPVSLPHPELIVLLTHNCPERLARAWNAGIRSVVYFEDPVNTAVLAIMAASLRVPRPRACGSQTTQGGGAESADAPRRTVPDER